MHLLDVREKRHSFQNNFYFCHFVNRTCVGFLMSFFGSTRSWGLFAAKCIPSTKKYDGGYSTKKEKFLPHTWLENWLYKRAINPKKEALTNVLIASLASYTPSANCSLEFRPMFTLTTDHVVNKIRSMNLTHRHFTTKSCSSCVNYCKKLLLTISSLYEINSESHRWTFAQVYTLKATTIFNSLVNTCKPINSGHDFKQIQSMK